MIENSNNGLSEAEARRLLSLHGPNALPRPESGGFFAEIKDLIREPMLILLLACAGVYLVLGDLIEGLVLGLSVFAVIAISLYQKIRSDRAIEALRGLSSPRALVYRDGIERKVAACELVPGDLISVSEGDRVPADGILLESPGLKVDESLLTGESLPADKTSGDAAFSSTLVVHGRARIRVLLTGAKTEVGKIGKSLNENEAPRLFLSTEIRQLTKIFAVSGILIFVAIVGLYGLTRGSWLHALLVGLATQMALLPEEFPVVLTVFMAIGAWRLSRVQVLVRKPEAVERLGAVSALCVDKTGTLTQNQMTVVSLHGSPRVLQVGVLATPLRPFDPMEKAFQRALPEAERSEVQKHWRLIREYGLTPELLAMSCVWQNPAAAQNEYFIATKGAPETVMDLCRLSGEERRSEMAAVKQLAARGQRVIGVAQGRFGGLELPPGQRDFSFEWIGLVGLEDPLRPEVPQAVALCRRAGIRVIMLTGDHSETAASIAAKAGIREAETVLTGRELQSLGDDAFAERISRCNVFARMIPEQKLRIVKALQSQGAVVGMTGDGVNDAPSLKRADVGIAMGARGTDVAREAADMVLLDDNFASIVEGIRGGRTIFINIKKALAFIISIHVPIAGLSIFPVLAGLPLLLLPVHIVLLELIIDPASTLLFESQRPERDPMAGPPRALDSRLFNASDLVRSLGQGILIFSAAALLFWHRLRTGHSEDEARTLAFGALILCNFGLIVADLTRGRPYEIFQLFRMRRNILIVAGFAVLFCVLFYFPVIRDFLKMAPLGPDMLLEISGVAFVCSTLIGIWNWIRA